MKLKGIVAVDATDKDDPLKFIALDGSTSELVTLAQVPTEVQAEVITQCEALEVTPLAIIIDFEGAV